MGDEDFVDDMQRKIAEDTRLEEVPSVQKRQVAQSLSTYEASSGQRNEAIYRSYRSGGYSMKAIADYFGLHYSSVSKIIKGVENS